MPDNPDVVGVSTSQQPPSSEKVPEVTTRSIRSLRYAPEFHDRAQHAAGLHGFECFVDVSRGGCARRRSRPGRGGRAGTGPRIRGSRGRAEVSPYHALLMEPPRPEHLIQRDVPGGAGCRHADEGRRGLPGRVPPNACLKVGAMPTASMTRSAPKPPVSSFDGLDGGRPWRVHGVGCAVLACACQLLFVDVDGDDGGCATELCACDCCGSDAAAADDCDGLAALSSPVFRTAPRPAVTPQPSRPIAAYCSGADVSGDLGALTCCDEGLLREGADTQRGGELGAVLEGHLLGCVVGCEAVLRLALCGMRGIRRRLHAS